MKILKDFDGEAHNERQTRKIGNGTPTPVEWVESYDYDPFLDKAIRNRFAACPTCKGYPLYGENPCPYCGQALIVEYPEGARKDEPGTEIIGATIDENGKTVCEKCGGTEFKLIAHSDGAEFFGADYRCEKCGNCVKTQTKRRRSGMYIF